MQVKKRKDCLGRNSIINTDFEKYCDNCDELEPVANIETVQYFGGSKTCITTIYCEHRHRCEEIRKSIEKS